MPKLGSQVNLLEAVTTMRKLLEVADSGAFTISATERARIEGVIATLQVFEDETDPDERVSVEIHYW
jgi:hypothetical protein